jgi:gamma-glutamylcyclotransferase (GGCT)/AIG2-like uncharacterized protein YtfP
MKSLFAYGTLMCEDIMADVSGCRLPGIAGTLKGHRRWSVQGEQYPAIAPDAESAVSGVVYRNVPGSAWDRLDRFEGEMYDRRPVDIELNDGSMLPAETYVIRPAFMNRLDPSDWDFDDFMSTGKESFQRHYKGYRSLM